MISSLYRGSVKDLLGPTRVGQTDVVIFEYTDAYSVFDWGRMPDFLTRKGQALAVLAAEFFEMLEKPDIWKEFSKTPEALLLRKANRFGAIFNEIGEELQSEGLRTHYLGVLDALPQKLDSQPKRISSPTPDQEVKQPFRHMVVQRVSVVKPVVTSVLGRALPDYYPTRTAPYPRLIPLEVVFRLASHPESSILDRAKRDPSYVASLGFPDVQLEVGTKWPFPILELFTKLESTDRPVPLSEALAISGLSAQQLQEMLLKSAWVAGILRYWCGKHGLELADGKIEWAISEKGKCFLVDAIGPDELRLTKNGVQLSKEFLRNYYRKTHWFQTMEKAKAQAKALGTMEWKRFVQETPPALPPQYRELAVQMYMALTQELTERKWFPDCWSLSRVTEELAKLS